MVLCPACPSVELVDFLADEGVLVELCPSCKGLLLDADELEPLTGKSLAALRETASSALTAPPSPLTAELPPLTSALPLLELPPPSTSSERAELGCPRCAARLEELRSDGGALLFWCCPGCSVSWLRAGTVERLRRLPQRPAAAAAPPSARLPHGAAAAAPPPARTPSAAPWSASPPQSLPLHSRSSFDEGRANLIGVPAALVLSGLFCAGSFGRFLAQLVAMPLHELGHATASWLTSRFAVPLPFFTIWASEQSWFVGLAVAACLVGFAVLSAREGSRWGLALSLGLLGAQLVLSALVSARDSLFLQIASGALGEIFFGALLLVSFHFPLPDRLRWDFWRWFALAPGALSSTQALLLWLAARSDTSLLPWGSALGSAADGDMNRLVAHFGWSAEELATLYSRAALLGLAAVLAAWLVSARRWTERSKHKRLLQSGSAAGGPT